MKRNLIKTMMALLAVLVFGIVGCGGGGGGSSTPPNTTVVSTAKLFPLTATPATSFTLSGSDNLGGIWSGSLMIRGDGQTTFEGQNLNKIYQQVSVALSGGSSSTSYISSYYNSNGSLYKSVYTGSTSGYSIQTNSFSIPSTFKNGDSIIGPALTTYINGTTDYQTTTYQVTDGGSGNLKVIGVIDTASGTSKTTTEYIISPAGNILSIKMTIVYPTLGRTVTLNGTLI